MRQQKLAHRSDPRIEIFVAQRGVLRATGVVGFKESLTWGTWKSQGIFRENPAWKGKTVEQLEAEGIIPKPTPPQPMRSYDIREYRRA